MNLNKNGHTISAGVDELISKLRDEGVQKGQSEASEIVANAEKRAAWLIQQAEEESQKMLQQARLDAEKFRQGGEDALQIAARDMSLQIKERLAKQFRMELENLVSKQMTDEHFLQKMIIELLSKVRDQSGLDQADNAEVILPKDAVDFAQLKHNPESLEEGSLAYFVQATAAELLRKGVTFSSTDNHQHGITIKLIDSDIEIDLSEQAVVALLFDHLQPRFRALLEGVLR